MNLELDFITLAVIVTVGIAGHLALAFSARWMNPLWTLAAAYMILVPLSMAQSIPGFEMFKYARMYVCILSIVTAVFLMRQYRLRAAGGAFLAFSVYYVVCALYSTSPINGFVFKSLYLFCVLAGVLAVYSTASIETLRLGFRVIVLAAAMFGLMITVAIVLNPVSISRIGRFAPLGMAPNQLGQEGAALLLCCCASALHDRQKIFKIVAVAAGTMLVVGILASGSRASAAMGMIGALIMALPMVKRPGLLLSLAGVSALMIFLILPSGASLENFQGREFNNRDFEWSMALGYFYENPLIGAGWVYDTSVRLSGSTQNMHSIYLQILAETGLLGVGLFVVVIFIGVFRGLAALRDSRHDREVLPWVFVAAAFCAATLAHGLAEASTIQGSSVNAMLLAMGFAMLDRLPEFARERAAAAADWAAWDEYEAAQYEEQPEYAPVPV